MCRVRKHAMRAVYVAMLVGQAVAAMADDGFNAAGEMGFLRLLYAISCTFENGTVVTVAADCAVFC